MIEMLLICLFVSVVSFILGYQCRQSYERIKTKERES